MGDTEGTAMDDLQSQNSHYCSCYHKLCDAYSFQRCVFFLLLFFLLCVAVMGAATLIIVFVMKPKKPIFSIQTIRLDSFKLDTSSSSSLYVSSIVSLTLNAQNPNMVGLRYNPSQLCVLYKEIPVGNIDVPQFYQPAHSKNVSVLTQVVFERVNISQIIGGVSLETAYSRKSIVKLRILGDIRAHVRVLHVNLPKIKVAIDCEMYFDYRRFIFNNGRRYSMKKDYKASLHTNSSSFSKNCSVAVYI